MEPLDIATLRAVLGIGATLLAAVLWRLESYGKKIVEHETTLVFIVKRVDDVEKTIKNGLTTELARITTAIEAHIDGEESRILAAVARVPRSRTYKRGGDDA